LLFPISWKDKFTRLVFRGKTTNFRDAGRQLYASPLKILEILSYIFGVQIPWKDKFTRLVFRGKTTNFENAGRELGRQPPHPPAPHERRPENEPLWTAHINSWSHATDAVQKEMDADGLHSPSV